MKRAVLLDVDGTLVDSNVAHAMAWVDAFDSFGSHDVTYDQVRALIGKGGDKLLPETIHIEKDSAEGIEIARVRSAIFTKRYLPTLRAFPGARELLQRLRARDLHLTVATSATDDELKSILKVAGIDDLLGDTVSSSDAAHSKPDPDIVLAALRSAKCRASEAIMLGDTPYDLEACTKAGVQMIALRCGGWGDDEFPGALAIFDDPQDLLSHLGEWPFR